MSIPSIITNGDYAHSHAFGSMPDDTEAVGHYRAILSNLDRAGTRYAVVSRSYWYDITDDGLRDPEGESETEIYVLPTPQFLADMFDQLGSFTRDDGTRDGMTRYYSEPSEYYEACVSGGIASQRPVTESYCIDLHNVSPLVRGVIERHGKVGR